jgi:outer membrane murein-binding lipoprotein Lpp
MTERDTDIDFDFFDEPETEEATERVRLPRRSTGGPGGPRRPMRAPQGFIPMLRLAGLIAFLILAVILIVFAVRGCASNSKHSAYASYMAKVQTIAKSSAQIGRELNQTLTGTGIKEAALESKVRGFAGEESQLADQAKAITPPGPLHNEHDHLIEVLQLRASGLGRLADAFAQTASAKDATHAGGLLATQARLLVASDVNYDFYFRDASRAVLKQQNVTGVDVPASNVIANPDLVASSTAMGTVWQRLHGTRASSTPGGKHGSALVSVTALPDDKKLDPSTETTITASTDLAFQVAVQDSGSFQEFDVKVTLTIARTPKPIQQTQTIPIINAGETKTVTFKDLGAPPYAVPTTLKVDVQPVPGERTRSNNSAEYRVIFSLG